MGRTRDVVIVDGARTPMAEYNGHFKDTTAIDLAVVTAKEAMRRAGVEAGDVDHAVYGNALQTSGDAIYGARHVALKAGLPVETPALTVNRLCGSGIAAIVQAARLVMQGEARTVLAGGMENLSQAPHVIRGARSGFRLGGGQLEDALMVALMDSYCGLYMANTAEKLAEKYGISREEMDAYALRSQEAAKAAYDAGRIQPEIAPVEVGAGKNKTKVEADDHMRPETTIEGLAKLRPAFGKDGCVTAGNASGIVDGAASVVVMSAGEAETRGKKPIGALLGWATVGVEPSLMGIGPVPASRKVVADAGLKLTDVDLIEVNEAFSPQYLAVEKALELDRTKVNVNGGAIALGHPLAATGTRLVLTLLYELRRRKARYGLATACIGGGQGIAALVEAL
ncbi:MAG: acetyl-CoA C-acetyltransferase [Acidobacteriota bacterium]